MPDVSVPWSWCDEPNRNHRTYRVELPNQTITIDSEELNRIIAESYGMEYDKLADIREITFGEHVSFELDKDTDYVRVYPVPEEFIALENGHAVRRRSKPFSLKMEDSATPPQAPPDIGDDFLNACLG